MIEVEAEGVEGEAADGVVAIAVFDVAADGVTEILHVYADLVFATRFQFQFDQRVVVVGTKYSEVCNGKFAAIVCWRGAGDIVFIVLQPTFHGAFALFHSA